MADSPEIRTQIGLIRYLEVLEPKVAQDIAKLRQRDRDVATALAGYAERTVELAPEDWRTNVRSMLDRLIALSISCPTCATEIDIRQSKTDGDLAQIFRDGVSLNSK